MKEKGGGGSMKGSGSLLGRQKKGSKGRKPSTGRKNYSFQQLGRRLE